MSWITPFDGKTPQVHLDAYLDISARLIGDVAIDRDASIWPMAVLRADCEPIRVGRGAAILDLALLETPQGRPIYIAEDALVSHGAMVHGARVETGALVGIGAIVLDGSTVGAGSIIGAGSVVSPGTQVPPNSLVLGVPGRIIRETTLQERQNVVDQLADLHRKSRRLMGR